MTRMLARVSPIGGDLYLIEDVTRPTDPGFGGGIPAFGGRPDNSLPGSPGHPWLPGMGHPERPSNELPRMGGHPWPPRVGNRPGAGNDLPWGPGHPGNALPIPPVRPSP